MSKPTPMKVAREFAKGHWINMIAPKYGVGEASIEDMLMRVMAKLLAERGIADDRG